MAGHKPDHVPSLRSSAEADQFHQHAALTHAGGATDAPAPSARLLLTKEAMKPEILDKKSGARRNIDDTRRIALDRPSVVFLKLAPEKVARYERHGDDLVLVLKDGQEITIQGFFVKYQDADTSDNAPADAANATADGTPADHLPARNDLVLEDDNGVTWWGQYPEQWSEFHFTEIEEDFAPAAAWWPYLLGALGAVGLGALAAGSGGGSDGGDREPVAHPPVATDDTAKGSEDGGPVTGKLLTNDSDPDGDALSVTQFTVGGKTYNAGDTATIDGVGTITVGGDGSYTFTPNPNWHGSVPPVTYTVSDGKGGTDTAGLTIVIDPVKDLAAGDDNATTREDTPVSGSVAGNDSTTSGGSLTFAKASDPEHGSVVVNADGTYTYTPDANYHGSDSFTYTVTDPDSGESSTQTVTITVNPVNDAPEANGTIADQANADADGVSGLDTSSFFSDADGDTLHYSASNLPDGLMIDPNTGIISGTIDHSASQDGANGVYSVTVTASDGTDSVDQTFTWTVTNPAPTAADDSATTAEDTAVGGNVLANDGDPDGDSLTVTGFTIDGDATPHHPGDTVTIAGVGEFALDSDGGYTFTPDADWNGTVPTITYTISDSEGGGDTADLVITVTPVNDPPVAEGTIADQANADTDGITPLETSSFFSDVDDNTRHYSASGLPRGLSIDPDTGIISGTIDHSASQDGANGVYSVVVTATDGDGASVDQTFTWTVTNPAPVAADDAATTAEDTAVGGNVLTNDGDPDGDTLGVTGFTVAGDAMLHAAGDSVVIAGIGTFTLDGDGGYTFTPAADWNGTVPTITYTISDGEGGTDTADLVITVTPVNDTPDANGTISDQVNADADGVASLDTSSFFSDADGDTLHYSASGLPQGLTIDPDTGIISGTIDHSASQDGTNGVYSVTVTATDGDGASVDQTFTWTVTNPAPTAADDTATTAEDKAVGGNVLANDGDPDGDSLTVTGFTVAGDPSPHNAGDTVTITGVGQFTLDGNGAYTFTPAADWNGAVPTITYTLSDGEGGTDTADLVITVTPVNDTPVAEGTIADQANADADGVTGLDASSFFSDVDGDTLHYSASGLPQGLTIDPDTGIISGTIDHSASQDGANGVYSVTVTATDGDGASVDQTFIWTVTNPAPVANDDAATTTEESPVSGNVLAGGGPGDVADGDPDGDSLSVTGFTVAGDAMLHAAGDTVAIAGVGQFTLDGNGAYTFTPDADWNGTVPTITYTISDGEGGTDTADLVITVTPVNDAPMAEGTIADQANADADGVTGLDASSFFSDVDGDTLHYSASGLPQGLTIDPTTGIISGTIDHSASQDGANGVYSITVTASDGTDSVDQTFTWTVTNPAPTANDDSATTAEDTAVGGNVLTNDGDPDGDSLTVTGFTIDGDATPHHPGDSVVIAGIGTFTLDGTGAYTFTPAADWNGTVPTVTYTISDGEGGTDTADLVITVTPVNDPPVAEGTIADQANADADGVTGLDVSSFFSDPESNTLHYSASNLPDGLTIDPDTGIISGTIDHSASQDGASGVYSVTLTATDGTDSVDQTFTWTVTNPAPTANDDTATTAEDTVVGGNVLANDGDPDGDSLTVTGFTIDGDATPHHPGDSVVIAGIGTFTLDGTGAYTFTPATDWNGTVPTVTYTLSDGEGGTDTADLVITVTPVPDAPIIAGGDVSSSVVEAGNLDDGAVVAGTPSATGSFTATDADGDSLTWTVLGTANTTYGTFSLDSTGGWTYTLNNALPATQALNEGDSIPLTYEVQVGDGNGGTDTRTVTITITGTNDAPVATADVGTVVEAGVLNGGNTATAGTASAAGNVLANDTDVDAGDTLSVGAVRFGGSDGTVGTALSGTYGSLVLNADGSYTYALDNNDADTQALKQGESASEVFTYTATDSHGAISTNTLTITVTGTNDRPVITSAPADATGDVTEQGTANPAEPNSATGTLTASDVDADATQTWSIAAKTGTYGAISIDPATGKWTYTLDNSLPATQALNDGDTRTETFTARVTDDHGAWSEQVVTVTVHGTNDDLAGSGATTVTLTEDGSATGTLQDYVADVDNAIVLTGFKVDADGDGVDESFAPGSIVTLVDADGNTLGTLTIAANGGYVFTPAADYAGDVPTVTYTMAESGGGASVTQTLDFEITKVSDAPDLDANKAVSTNEDTPVSLGLHAPVVTDTGTGTANNDNPERIGAITLTIGGAGAAGVTLSTGAQTLTPVGGKITIVLTDMDHVTNVPPANPATATYYLTTAEYEALIAHPPAESGRDFTVTVGATSYEVDASGAIIAGVAGASSTQVVNVDVQAVTDGAILTTSQTNLTFAEDSSVNLSGLLTAARADPEPNGTVDDDGSERYSYTVSGLLSGTVVTINGTNYTVGASGAVTTAESATFTAAPSVIIKPPADFSGDMGAVTITLNTRDTDTDSTGIPATLTSSVTLNLHVTPMAGDVTATNVTTVEDTAVAFLAGVAVTDAGSGATGSEVINSVSFEVPTGWVVTPPTASVGWSYDLTGTTATITFTNQLNEGAREAILDAFTIKPPANDSTDKTITLSIESTDSNSVNGTPASDTKTVDRDVKITVTPVAERADTDSDGAGGNDVRLNADHDYSGATGKEDAWFALGTNYTDATNAGNGFAGLKTPWSNADTDEFTYAVLTPTLESDTPGDTVIGSQFRYSTDGGATWQVQTYAGEPLWIPVQYLDTLQVKLPPDVSGTMTIGVQAGTVDYDDDAEQPFTLNPPHVSGPGVDVEVSGSATLTLIKFDPVADAVTMALNGRASGLEDTAIPLSIKTSSSDSSETFDVTISGIPVGATITYGTGGSAVTFTASAGNTSFEIVGFSNATPMTITPPANSNEDFTLTVSAVSVDGTDILATPVSRTIDVSVTGVADAAVVTLPSTGYSTTEAALDSGGHKVALSDLVTSVTSPDTDGSEAVTLRITELAADFTVTGATVVVSGTGAERVWLVSAGNLASVSIVTPENYSGTVAFKVAGVTTENDGDSRTGAPTDVSFTVTPSPEATITTAATLVEDAVTPLHLALVAQHGDTNEVLGKVYVATGYDTSSYTLYLGDTALSAAGLATTVIGGVTYYVVPADQVGDLGAKGAANLDGNAGSLDFLFEVTDPSNDGTLPATTEIQSGSIALDITPVTDPVDASITAITAATGTTADNIAGDDAAPDTATVTASGTVTVNLHVDSADTDGSEHLIRVLIEGVPDGVTVTGAAQVGAGSWLLVYDGGDAKAIGAGGIDVPVEFIVGRGVGDGTSTIAMTVQARDEGQSATSPAGIETDTVQWNLVLELADGAPYAPPSIDEWHYNGNEGTEDTAFTLSSVIDATVSTSDPASAYTYTVTITDLPPGTIVAGMILTTIAGVPTWTATVTVPANGDSQAMLDDLLAGITITPPANSNDNNADFSFDAKLTAAAVGGPSVVSDTTADMPVVPVTDEAAVTVTTNDVGEGGASVVATITAADIADGVHGTIVDGKLYVQVSTHGNDGGTLTDGSGHTLSLSPVSGVDGVPDGDYYVIDIGAGGGSVDLTYTAPDGSVLEPGDVTFTAWTQTQETGAANTVAASASGTADIVIVNNGVAVTSLPAAGAEAASPDKGNAIELTGLSVALNDNDGSEAIHSILLSGVPVGFLLYVGTSAGDATLAAQASNAGGDGVTNTWVLSEGGDLPAYVAILPATNWSGTLDGLSLVVESGETSLSTSRIDTVDLGTVTVEAVANGLTIDPTVSFGTEGRVIDLNLNAAMADAAAAAAAVPDGSLETTTLQLTGLGEHAAFYVGDTPIGSVGYDAGTDTYTITGLTQDDLDDLGVVQAASALSDQDAATAGTQVTVTAWTVESANGDESAHVSDTLTLAVTPVLATTGNDSFIWNGQAIDGKAGTDTVSLRAGEDVTHVDLANLLKNVEVIDLSAPGENSITGGLSIADVLKITGSNTGTLTIDGDADDKLQLSSHTEWSTNGAVTDGHVTYTSTSGATLLVNEDIYHNNHVSYAA